MDLDLGFNTESSLKIDGNRITTQGQCHVAADKEHCEAKNCTWTDVGTCEISPTPVELQPGGHCVEAVVLVTSGARTIKLSYSGPDSRDVMTLMPAQVLYCDPVVKACVQPEVN